jgi:outer membrane protein OmpA-like peptidoglycan-associated protein
MAQPQLSGRSVRVFGFSDNGSSPAEAAAAVSQEFADVVARQLRARGLPVEVSRGFGGVMPVADNRTDEGRDRNRRVEVWLH